MPGFRLKMATLHGEKVAADHGFQTLPVEPLAIATAKHIEVVANTSETAGVSGALIFAGNSVCLMYSTALGNSGFERFSVSHELGHYFLPGHPEEIQKQGGRHLSRANFTENSSIELEADHFASGLLMPADLTKAFLAKQKVGLDGILALADQAQTSLTAAAIRTAVCAGYPVAIIVSQGCDIAYAFLSEDFKGLGQLPFLRKGTPLPASATLQFNGARENVLTAKRLCASTTLGAWFDGAGNLPLDEEVLGLGAYGYTLTVLSSEAIEAETENEIDEEAELEERWTPRFAHGR